MFTVNGTYSKILILFVIVNIFSACNKKEDSIPDTPVNFTISLNDPLYRDLRTVGNSTTVVGGHAGIVIYRLSQTDFIAFDRLCPHEQKVSCRLQETDDDLFYTCECCNTPYLLLDGTGQSKNDSVFPGTGKFLKEYRADFDGIGSLRISNF